MKDIGCGLKGVSWVLALGVEGLGFGVTGRGRLGVGV